MLEPLERFLRRVGCLVLLDRAADPAANGHVQRNGTHVKVFSGGAVRNLSDVGTAPAHATNHQPAGSDAMAVDAAAGTGSLRTLGTTALKAAAGDHAHTGTLQVIRKTANESVTNSAVLQNDDHISFAIGASETWVFTLYGFVTEPGVSVGGIQVGWSLPTGGTFMQTIVGGAGGNVIDANAKLAVNVKMSAADGIRGGTPSVSWFILYGVLKNSATAGTAQFQWAQLTADPTATQLLTDTFLVAHKV